MTITLKRTVNLSEPILPEVLQAPLYEGEKNAHTFMITAEKDKLPHALSGSVVAYFERNDGNTVRVEGETKDGAAILTLSPECYQTGVFYLAVMLISDGAQTVIYAASGRVRNTQDGEIIDGGNTIPTYDEIMAHLQKYLSTDITAKVEETEDGALITMKDVVNGETRAIVKHGKTAYKIAVENGFEGTEEEWLESLKGKDGENSSKNLLDGTAEGSMRSAGSAPETDDYKLGKNAVSIGYKTKAPGEHSFAEGGYTEAIGTCAHTEGSFAKAEADYTHAEGMGTIAASQGQHVQGKNNIRDAEGKYLHIVGNGINADQRKNAHTIDTNGNAWYSGDVFVGGTGQNDKNAEKLVKQSELDAISSESGKVMIVRLEPRNTNAYHYDPSFEEIEQAMADGKVVFLIDANNLVYLYNHRTINADETQENLWFISLNEDKVTHEIKRKLIFITNVANGSAYDVTDQYSQLKAPNPKKIIFTGAVEQEYDGTEEITVNVPETSENGVGNASAFVVKVTYYFDQNDNGDESIYTADKTHAEIREAVERGDIVICELNYNYKANGATGSTGFDPLYLPYVTRSRNNLLCFAATFQNGFVFPYSGADSNHVVVTLDKNAKPDVYFKSFVHKSDLPLELPNPNYLVITQGTKRWNYKGFEEVNVDLDPPTTSLPWNAITDKPFGVDVPLDVTIDSAAFDGYLYTPFVLTAGTKYTISCKIGEMAFDFTDVTATEKNLEGINTVCLGNLHLLNEVFEDTGEQYLIVNIPDGIYIRDNVYAYGLVVITGLTVPEGVTIALKIVNPDGAKPIPEELIPTMSETTKGGAMVGKGLKMVGDKLTVEGANAENAGKLLFVNEKGTLSTLSLGTGLKIVDGVLTIEASMARAVAGMALAGQVKVGEV